MVTHDPRYGDVATRSMQLFDGRVVDDATEQR
jgi:ABC-type lipoprotein export system ATPase subunit